MNFNESGVKLEQVISFYYVRRIIKDDDRGETNQKSNNNGQKYIQQHKGILKCRE